MPEINADAICADYLATSHALMQRILVEERELEVHDGALRPAILLARGGDAELVVEQRV